MAPDQRDGPQAQPRPAVIRPSQGGTARRTAIAIENDDGIAGPPRISAKGHGKVAEQILALAFANDVKVREDADLVAVLNAVEVDSEVPLFALAAVAEILSYVYQANQTSPAADKTAKT